MRWPTVICERCNKPVELMRFFEDNITDQHVFQVRCHGEWDEMRLSGFDITPEVAQQLNNSVGRAFTTKRLEAL